MRATAGAVLLLTWMCGFAIAEDVNSEIARFCKNEWPSDFTMEEYCRKRQAEGITSLTQRVDTYKASGGNAQVLNDILQKCGQEWWNATARALDYSMWDYCVKQQIEAAKRMGY